MTRIFELARLAILFQVAREDRDFATAALCRRAILTLGGVA